MIHVNGVPYTQLQTIGRGGSSKVYLVQGPGGEQVAIKRVTTDNPKQLEAFQNEVSLLRQLQDCDRVIQVSDAEVDYDRGRIHIVMEVGDTDLSKFLQTEGTLSLNQIRNLWRQMLQAVQVIHDQRIVHADLKPGNFVLVNGQLKVIDFGIAKRISSDTTNISRETSVGTLSYMAPEAVKQGHHKIGRQSDVWSLGVILYQMVYGTPPFGHLEPMQRLLALNDPSLVVQFPATCRLQACSEAARTQLTQILQGCLHRDPSRRPSLRELLAHPFMHTSARVHREAVEATVGAIVTGFLGAVRSSLRLPDEVSVALHDQELHVLAEQIWEDLVPPKAGQGSDDGALARALAPLGDRLAAALAKTSASAQESRLPRPTAGVSPPLSGVCRGKENAQPQLGKACSLPVSAGHVKEPLRPRSGKECSVPAFADENRPRIPPTAFKVDPSPGGVAQGGSLQAQGQNRVLQLLSQERGLHVDPKKEDLPSKPEARGPSCEDSIELMERRGTIRRLA